MTKIVKILNSKKILQKFYFSKSTKLFNFSENPTDTILERFCVKYKKIVECIESQKLSFKKFVLSIEVTKQVHAFKMVDAKDN